MTQSATEEVVHRWYDALDKGDVEAALNCFTDDVDWDNISATPGISDVIPWLGRFRGREGARHAFNLRAPVVDVLSFKTTTLLIVGDEAFAMVHEISRCKATGKTFEIDIAQYMKAVDGRIAVWKSVCDTAPIVASFR